MEYTYCVFVFAVHVRLRHIFLGATHVTGSLLTPVTLHVLSEQGAESYLFTSTAMEYTPILIPDFAAWCIYRVIVHAVYQCNTRVAEPGDVAQGQRTR